MKSLNAISSKGPVDIKFINEFEEEIGFRFPDNYKALISKDNALYPEEMIFDFINVESSRKDERDVSFYGYGSDIEDYDDIKRQDFDVYGHNGVIAFGRSANGDYVCFDYRDNPLTDDPPVVVMLHDYPDENNKMLICHVADSFEKFVDSLHDYD